MAPLSASLRKVVVALVCVSLFLAKAKSQLNAVFKFAVNAGTPAGSAQTTLSRPVAERVTSPLDRLTSPVPVPLFTVTFGYPAVSTAATAVLLQWVTETRMSSASCG